ncbi:GNAT family N-acetyltransferase [Nonomuraea sp. NPDC049152]|uniref:GNAT family N-acetyltransferase n=1 Tax=Nonomuraea sp. NPDC049152 TaxID=3154350 RepID=UPI0033ECF509
MSDEHLTHGWEPDLDAGDSLVRRFVLANADRNAFVAACAGGRAERWEDLAVADPASQVLFDNAAVLLRPPAYIDLADTLRRLLAFYPPERHFVFLSVWPTPDLSGEGLELMGHPPLMLRPPGGTRPAVPETLRIVPVADRLGLDDFVGTLVEAYPMPEAKGTIFGDVRVLRGPVKLFVGYVGDQPVATSGARLGHGIVDVEWVSTLPAYRGRGIGTALTWAATAVEPDQPAMLIASDEGRPVYEAMGYLRLMRLTMWHRPPVA